MLYNRLLHEYIKVVNILFNISNIKDMELKIDNRRKTNKSFCYFHQQKRNKVLEQIWIKSIIESVIDMPALAKLVSAFSKLVLVVWPTDKDHNFKKFTSYLNP